MTRTQKTVCRRPVRGRDRPGYEGISRCEKIVTKSSQCI